MSINIKKVNIERLQRIVAHLRTGKLSVDKFDFRSLHEEYSCGTLGCAMGEFHIIFPEYFKLTKSYDKLSRETQYDFRNVSTNRIISIEGKIKSFLGIDELVSALLFYPSYLFTATRQKTEAKELKNHHVFSLLGDSTREMVAQNIENFINYVQQASQPAKN